MYTTLMAGIAGSLVPVLLFAQPPRKKITRAADVPQFQYSIKGSVEDLVQSEEAFRPLAAEMRKNVESILRDYDVEDASTKRGLVGVLASLDLVEGRDDDARRRLAEIKALEEKPAAKALSGLISGAILEARRDVHDRNSPAYRQAVYAAVKRTLDGLPFDVIQNDLKSIRASVEVMTAPLVIGQIRSRRAGSARIWRTRFPTSARC